LLNLNSIGQSDGSAFCFIETLKYKSTDPADNLRNKTSFSYIFACIQLLIVRNTIENTFENYALYKQKITLGYLNQPVQEFAIRA
jgi:hypothetical protein